MSGGRGGERATRRFESLAIGQCRNDLTGRVTTGRHPCSPREVTLGASPPRPWPGGSRGFFITPTASVASSPERLPRDTVKKKKEMLMLLSRFICMRDFETPERNTPCMWPSLKTNDRLRSVLRSAFPGDVLREGGRGRMTNARRKKKIGDASGENECPRETDAVALVSRKMVNVLIVDPHWASVIGIKLCINRERPGFGGSPRDRGPERGAGRPRGERRAGVEHPNFQTN